MTIRLRTTPFDIPAGDLQLGAPVNARNSMSMLSRIFFAAWVLPTAPSMVSYSEPRQLTGTPSKLLKFKTRRSSSREKGFSSTLR